jgi:uncharacterized damage-inducible protein DinB
MTSPEMLQFLWRYMVHADQQIMQAAATVSDEGYRRDQQISFGSIEKLVNHCMTVQRLWLERLHGNDVVYSEEAAPARGEFASRWDQVHQGLLAFAAAQTAESLGRPIAARSRAGQRFELPVWVCMHHVADHGTYHRGQLNSMIKLAGGAPSLVMMPPFAVGQGHGRVL